MMETFLPSAEAEEFRGQVRKFLQAYGAPARVSGGLETIDGYDESLWRRAVEELGVTALLVPESAGGAGASLPTLGVVFEEFGRTLACAPLLSTVGLATPALLRACSPEVARPLFDRIATGSVATLAWAGPEPSGTTLRWDGDVVYGTAPTVLDPVDADIVLVAARTGDGKVALIEVDHEAAGLRRTAELALDTTRRLGQMHFEAANGTILAVDAATALETAFATTVLLLGAEQVGGGQRVVEMAVEHARTRVQFGRPIGSFQAIKHRCADMLMDVELSRSLVAHALNVAEQEPEAAVLESALVKGFVPDAYVGVAGASIQIHGGLGFTWEHDAHLFLKRAKSGQLLFGAPTAHRRRAAELLELPA